MADLSHLSDDDLQSAIRTRIGGRGLSQKVDDFGRGFADAASFGLADEIAAGMGAATGIGGNFGDYEGNLAAQRERDNGSGGARLAGQLAGGVAGGVLTGNPASFGKSMAAAGAQGAAYGFGSGEGSGRAMGAATGALGGLGGAAAVRGIGRVISPRVSDGVRTLLREGVPVTPGSMIGGAAKRLEDSLVSSPLVGAPIRAAQNRATVGLNRAANNRVLRSIGESVPKTVQPGREMVEYVADRVSAAYDDLLPKLSVRADEQWQSSLANLRDMTTEMLPDRAKQFETILENKVLRHFSEGGGMTGESMKRAESELGRKIRQFSTSPDADQRELGSALRELQDQLRQLVQRSNPQESGRLAAINKAFANKVITERASAALGADGGVFTAPQLANAVKASNATARKTGYAKGRALMQDLSDPAKDLLQSRVNNSGTAERLLASPQAIPLLPLSAIPAIMSGALYSPAGTRMAAAALAKRPQGADLLAEAVRKYLAGGGVIGGAALAIPALEGVR